MPWGGGGRRRLALGKSRLKHLRKPHEETKDDPESNGAGNPLAGLLGGYEDDEETGEGVDAKLLESSAEEEESDSPDEPSPKRPNEDDCEWAATKDPNTGKAYYWNRVSGKTSWEKPTELIDLDHQKTQYKRMKELVERRRADKKRRREEAKKEREERRQLRAKLRAKAEAERVAKEKEEKRKAEEMKSQLALFMGQINEDIEEQKKKQAEEDAKRKQEDEDAQREKEKKEREKAKLEEEKKKKQAIDLETKIKKELKRKTKWRSVKDKTTGKMYFWNKDSGATTWTKPEEYEKAEIEAKKALERESGARTSRKREGSSPRSSEKSSTRDSRSSVDKENDVLTEANGKLLIEAMIAGIRCCIKDAWPGIPEGTKISELIRVRVELDLRIDDWKKGHVSGRNTRTRLRELGEKVQNVLKKRKEMDVENNTTIAPKTVQKAAITQEQAGKSRVTDKLLQKGKGPEEISINKEDLDGQIAELSAPLPEHEERDGSSIIQEDAPNVPTSAATTAPIKKRRKLKIKDKKMAGLVSKWAAVQRQQHSEDGPVTAYERRKIQESKEVEEWKKRQVKSGAAVSNENFIPVEDTDWKLRVAKKKRARDGSEVDIGDDW
mmetsp:Transcript_11164/g.18217  ORF Transcript_11164/g.18217 Transcript_11164/m.18217 type:complete len:609 (+) Transcript_11164:115-1941(+)